jgi:hypothetical protein
MTKNVKNLIMLITIIIMIGHLSKPLLNIIIISQQFSSLTRQIPSMNRLHVITKYINMSSELTIFNYR